jgi:hypothetical protein
MILSRILASICGASKKMMGRFLPSENGSMTYLVDDDD